MHPATANRHFTEADIEEYIYDDDQDDFLVAEDRECQQSREGGEPSVQKFGDISQTPNRGRVEEKEEDSIGSEDEENSQEREQSEKGSGRKSLREKRLRKKIPLSLQLRLKMSYFLKILPIWTQLTHILYISTHQIQIEMSQKMI